MNKHHKERKDFLEKLEIIYPGETNPPSKPFDSFNTKDCVVWIDPLDGTSDYVAGNLPACTVLIGLAINGQSKFGIVH